MESGKRILMAVALIAVALSATAYATAIGGASAVSTDEISVKYELRDVSKFPTGSAIEREIGRIALGNFSDAGLREGDNIRVRFELILDNPDIVKGLRSFVVKIEKGDNVVALLTPYAPYDEVVETLSGSPPRAISYDVKVIAFAGHKKLDAASFRVRATAMVENMA